jgi:peroxiredoxin
VHALLLALGLSLQAHAAPRVKPTTAPARAGVVAEGTGLTAGAPAPRGLAAHDLSGAPVALDALLAEGPTLLVFYRGGWCPYCNHQLHALSQAAPRFEAAGVRVVALSVDKPQEGALTQKSWEIPFPVLSDSALAVHEAFGVVFAIDADTRARYQRIGIDLERSSGRTDGKVAVPSMFLVKDGAVAWAHVDPAYKVRPTPEQVLAALAGAGLPNSFSGAQIAHP